MYQQLFDDLIGEAPPSTVDIQALMDRQRRALHRRRVGAVGGSLAAVLAIGSLAWVVPAGGPAPTGPSTASPAGLVDDLPGSDSRAVRLAAAAHRALTAADPSAVVAPGDFEMFRSTGPMLTYQGTGLITAHGLHGRLTITVMRGSVIQHCGIPSDCQPVTGPRGETGTLLTSFGRDGGMLGCSVLLDRQPVDGSTVQVEVNGDHTHAGTNLEAPLSTAEVIQIAEDPALSINP
jgi:hypothetical protein